MSHTPNDSHHLQPSAGLGRNLCAGLALAFGLRVRAPGFAVSAGQGGLLLVLLALQEIGIGYLMTDAPARFDGYGLNHLAAGYLLTLLLLLIGCALAPARGEQIGRVLVGYLSAALPIALCAHLLWWILLQVESGWIGIGALFMGLLLWQGGMVLRLLRGCTGTSRRRASAAALLFVLALLASVWVLPRTELWYTDYPESAQLEPAPPALDVEAIYYAQPGLMARSLAELAPQRPGVVDLYLLNLGGYAWENVFLNEVEYVQQQFDRQYLTAGRSMILANNPARLDTYPLANRHNLQAALNGIATQMDRDEDVLFLFLTSHGSADHRFSLELGALQLNDLTAEELRQALDQAGIRWRVILVSSCYSGGFIEPLQTPETLIITAAAADRTSFGCGVDSEFTYFGTAYFKQALPQQPRFIEAFELAQHWVTEREEQEGMTPSQPQRFVGAEIAAKLEALYAEVALQGGLVGQAAPRN